MKAPNYNNGTHFFKDGTCLFSLWAPDFKAVELKICQPKEKYFSMAKNDNGFWKLKLNDISPNTTYKFRLNNDREIPDPASHYQPTGVHEPSQVVCHEDFNWEDGTFSGIDLSQMIMYELHVGAFTTEGTFEAVIERLGDLLNLGINAIELMPVAQCPGNRNWGYDGVYPYGVQNSYGSPNGLKKLVNECHKKGIAVILDVVYNHLGPEGNYLWGLGHYFTDRYRTPWGNAINFDGSLSDNVKQFFIENAIYWFDRYHIDALRLDAVHAIFDFGAKTFLEQLAETVDKFCRLQRRKHYLIAESDLDDSKVIKPAALGGYGLDAQWSDDYHHCIHTLLTGETSGYYLDFGTIAHFTKTLREGYAYTGEYSKYRQRSHGSSAVGRKREQFVVFSQNHDQIGNRMTGERLSALVSFEALKLAAAAVILSPYVPMLFMGEEYGEEAPFQFFVNFSDNNLIENIRKGRKKEYREFHKKGTPPDPQDIGTFLHSKLHWEKQHEGNHKILLEFYKTLIKIRKENPAFYRINSVVLDVVGLEKEKAAIIKRYLITDDAQSVMCIFNFNKDAVAISLNGTETWERFLYSHDAMWAGIETLTSQTVTNDNPFTVAGLSVSLYKKKEAHYAS